jgi:hypothetical protein
MNPIEELKQRLDKLPNARYGLGCQLYHRLAHNANGFNVTLMQNSANSYTVFFNGWHENFEFSSEPIAEPARKRITHLLTCTKDTSV